MACSIFCLLLTILFLPITTIAHSNGTVAIGSSLTANENSTPWLSSNADFAFGFYQLENKDFFLVSIWYNRMPEKTPIWYGDGDNPSPRGSQLELTADRGLVLTDPTGQETLISDPIVGSVSFGVMMNTGNFVVLNTDSESLWESFNYPIDTILPSQIMETGGTLSSRRGELNFSRGRFQLNLLANGNLALRTINMPSEYRNEPYFSRGMNGSSSSRYQLIFNESASIYISGDNSSTSFVFSNGEGNPVTNFYHRATLNFDGVFTHYYRPRTLSSNQSWSVLWSIPDNICRRSFVAAGSGVCGYNRICRLNIDRRLDCQCPRAFTLIDPEDDYRGCVPNFVQSCDDELGTPEDLYDFDTVTNVDWPTSDYELLEPYNEDSCKRSCLND